jgi:Na+/pantothenate symporter
MLQGRSSTAEKGYRNMFIQSGMNLSFLTLAVFSVYPIVTEKWDILHYLLITAGILIAIDILLLTIVGIYLYPVVKALVVGKISFPILIKLFTAKKKEPNGAD